MRSTSLLICLTLMAAGITACDMPTEPDEAAVESTAVGVPGGPTANATLTELATEASEADTPEFTVLVDALEAADLIDLLSGPRTFTVFAPTDDAFGRLLERLGVTPEELLADTELLRSILLYHVVPGRRTIEDVQESEQIRTLNDGFVFPKVDDELTYMVDGDPLSPDAQIVESDVDASNGVIHVIDEVLVPGSGSGPGDGGLPTVAGFVTAAANAEEPEFTTLLAAVEAAGLAGALNGNGNITVFAPTDAAFEKLLAVLGLSEEELLADADLLRDVLLYHVANGKRSAVDVVASDQIRTLQGGFVFPAVVGDEALIVDGTDATEDAQLLETDVAVSNGVIHVIDEVLVPGAGSGPGGDDEEPELPTIAGLVSEAAAGETPEFGTLLAAVEAAGLLDELNSTGKITVFAPTDAAFEALLVLLDVTAEELLADADLLRDVLLYHIVNGERLAEDVLGSEKIRTRQGGFVFPSLDGETPFLVDGNADTEDAGFVDTDILASNGVVHVIDQVLLPGDGSGPGGGDAEPTVAEYIAQASEGETPEFTTLLAALGAAGLTEDLNSNRKVTVFAPTDAAFDDLLALLGMTAEELLADTDLLRDVLLYHVANGRRSAEDVFESDRLRTRGGFVFPLLEEGVPFIVDASDATANAQVVEADVDVRNGIIHVINQVLLPN